MSCVWGAPEPWSSAFASVFGPSFARVSRAHVPLRSVGLSLVKTDVSTLENEHPGETDGFSFDEPRDEFTRDPLLPPRGE